MKNVADDATTADMKALGLGPEVEVAGERYEVTPLTTTDWQTYSKFLRTRAWQRLLEQKDELGEEWYSYQSRLLQERIDVGAYDYLQPVFCLSLAQPEGLAKAYQISLDKKYRGKYPVKALVAMCEGKYRDDMLRLFARANSDDPDPKAPSSATPGSTSPASAEPSATARSPAASA